MQRPPLPDIPDFTVSICDYGSRENHLCSDAFTKAMECVSARGGGTIVVPAGRWITGPIHFCSHVRLHLEKGAHVLFSRRHEDYLPVVLAQRAGCWVMNYSPLLYARDAEHIAITGEGILDGQGDAWWEWKKNEDGVRRLIGMVRDRVAPEQRIFGRPEDCVRPNMLEFIHCHTILFEGVTIQESPAYLVHPVDCENLTIRNLRVIGNGPNTDGIDPEYCRNVWIENCFIDTGDDCLCLKAGRDQDGWDTAKPCENIVILRLRAHRGHGGIVLGSELSSGIRNVWVEDCDFSGTERGIRIKSSAGRGGFVRDITLRNIRMQAIRDEAIIIHTDYGTPGKGESGRNFSSNTTTPTLMENILIEDIRCHGARKSLELTGDSTLPLNQITLRRVNVDHCQEPATISHVTGLILDSICMNIA